jgi:hypothetical protein
MLAAQIAPEFLERTRDKVIPRLPQSPNFTCVETIERSYFTRARQRLTPATCEQISLERKKGRSKLQLHSTDRLRLQVAVNHGREIYSWTGPGTFSRDVEEILETGTIGTGQFSVYLLDIFSNPAVRFHLQGPDEFGFRVPIEASNNLFMGAGKWRQEAYEGSLVIDPQSLEVKTLRIKTSELSADTERCEMTTIIDYPTGGNGLLIPLKATTRDVLRDSSEIERVSTFSDCREVPTTLARSIPTPLQLPGNISLVIELNTPIETASASAGDVVRGTVRDPVLRPKSSEVLVPAGGTVTGRIVKIEHRIEFHEFALLLDFDSIEAPGIAFQLRARLDTRDKLVTGVGSMVGLVFPTAQANLVIPAGYKSKWLTM